MKETKLDVEKKIEELTKGAVSKWEGISLVCNCWGQTLYKKSELINIRNWIKKNLKGSAGE